MGQTTWPGILNPERQLASAGTALATSAALTDVSPANQLTIGADAVSKGGEVLRTAAWGVFSNTGTPTLLLGVYWGGIAGVALAASGAITTITAAANWPWQLETWTVFRTVGATGTAMTQGRLFMPASLTQFQAAYALPAANPQNTVTVDTTAAKALTIGAQWGTSSASNTLTLHGFVAELLN